MTRTFAAGQPGDMSYVEVELQVGPLDAGSELTVQVQTDLAGATLQADTNGSRRIAIDHNQPLIRDRLAFRLNLLHDEAREFRKYEGKNQERLTLSAGVASLRNLQDSRAALLQRSDEALYTAKQAGRNRVCMTP